MATKVGTSFPQVLQYVGYLIKVANMVQRFQWKSVLKYHAEYRKAQSEIWFAYGADSSYMMQLYLRDKTTQDPSILIPRAIRYTKFDPKSGKLTCSQFNATKGCQLQHCKFARVCRACFSGHRFTTHKDHNPTGTGSVDLKYLLMKAPTPVSPPPLLKHMAASERCFYEDNDTDFILQGIWHGFYW